MATATAAVKAKAATAQRGRDRAKVSELQTFTWVGLDKRGIKIKGGFITQPRRWVVERTFAWMHRCRRLTASTSRPYWPMRPWSSSASSRSCSAA